MAEPPRHNNDSSVPFSWPVVSVDETWSSAEVVSGGLSPLAIPRTSLSPVWQLLLAGDGSPTRQLALLTGHQTAIDVIDCTSLQHGQPEGAPAEVACLRPPLVRRRVFMRAGGGLPLMYAVSWWNADDYRKHMPEPSLPIGRSLAMGRLEVHRTLHSVFAGTCASDALGRALGSGSGGGDGSHGAAYRFPPGGALGGGYDDAAVWGRHYSLVHGGAPLSVIVEVFSPRLCGVLGPTRPLGGGASEAPWRADVPPKAPSPPIIMRTMTAGSPAQGRIRDGSGSEPLSAREEG